MSNLGKSRLVFVFFWICPAMTKQSVSAVQKQHAFSQELNLIVCFSSYWSFRCITSNTGSRLCMHHGCSIGSVYVIWRHQASEEEETCIVIAVLISCSPRSGKLIDQPMTRRDHTHHSSQCEWFTCDAKCIITEVLFSQKMIQFWWYTNTYTYPFFWTLNQTNFP